MQRIVHSFSCLILALALVLSGPGGTGPANGATMVVLCGGDTPSTIWLDADGNPVEPGVMHDKCLDCIIFSATLPETSALRSSLIPRRLPVGLIQAIPPKPEPIAHLRPDPRGPPLAPIVHRRDGGLRLVNWSLHLVASNRLDTYQAFPATLATGPRATFQRRPA